MLLSVADRFLLAPLALRLVLAAIFLYHGVLKVTGPANAWGADWVRSQWNREDRIPPEVERRLDILAVGKYRQEVLDTKNRLSDYYAEGARGVDYGIALNHAAQLAVAWGEVAGGLAMLLGFLTRLAALGLIIIQAGAIATVTFQKGFSFAAGGGFEYNLALLAMCLALVLTGGGLCSVDRWWWTRRNRGAPVPGPQQQLAPTM